MKKTLYLFLALLLPGLIFVFLKLAGKNEFVIPVYYEEKVSDSVNRCGLQYNVPYHIPDSVWKGNENILRANLFVFSEKDFVGDKIAADLEDELGAGMVNWIRVPGDPNENEKWKCVFLVSDPWQVVLVDDKGRIRGYYDPRLREELDKLRVELKILLKKY
ncbi:MAG TPA: hypothetical protein PLR06_13485 [Cyclobacteriaceae bacterium]|nr:hypothetical protein [Cyclobacteriaceae bacterium]